MVLVFVVHTCDTWGIGDGVIDGGVRGVAAGETPLRAGRELPTEHPVEVDQINEGIDALPDPDHLMCGVPRRGDDRGRGAA